MVQQACEVHAERTVSTVRKWFNCVDTSILLIYKLVSSTKYFCFFLGLCPVRCRVCIVWFYQDWHYHYQDMQNHISFESVNTV